MMLFRLLVLSLFLGTISSAAQQQGLDNHAIVQMTKAGLGDSIIIESVNATPGSYAVAPGDLIELKQAGVSERVIKAVIARSKVTNRVVDTPFAASSAITAATTEETISTDLTGVDELGVYYKGHDGKWTKMDPELVNFRSGGALKSYGTNHIIKQDRNGHLMGESAQLALSKPVDFLLSMPAGTDPVEYLLLKLRPGGQHGREFRSETGGVFHSSSGAMRDAVAFTAVKLAPHTYRFTLPATAGKGEYGILPPGSMSTSNAGIGGKIYTFKIIE